MPGTANPPNVRVVVQLPYNRPEQPFPNPPQIEWTQEKANILWEVIARSSDGSSDKTDWKGLAEHLQVPLPYLVYRARARFEENLRGLQDIDGLSTPHVSARSPTIVDDAGAASPPERLAIQIPTNKLTQPLASATRLTSSGRFHHPLGVRARLHSLGQNSPHKPKKAVSSSTSTLQARKVSNEDQDYAPAAHLPPVSPSNSSPSASDESDDSEEERAAKEEEAERREEEQETLNRKLQHLQRVMNADALGFVRSPISPSSSQLRAFGPGALAGPSTPTQAQDINFTRGRAPLPPQGSRSLHESFGGNMTRREEAARNRDHSASVSSASSPQGSIPSIPSPAADSASHSPRSQASPAPLRRGFSANAAKSQSPPAVSARNARGVRYGGGYGAFVGEQESNHGSSASSFSDLSDASLSPSALESALMSNIKGGNSRLSGITSRSRFSGTSRGVRH